MTTSPPGHRWEANGHLREAKTALVTTAKLRQLRTNSREMTTSAESCNDHEMQRPWNDKLETAQSLQNVHEILRRFMAVVISSAFRKSLMKVCVDRASKLYMREHRKKAKRRSDEPSSSSSLSLHRFVVAKTPRRINPPSTFAIKALRTATNTDWCRAWQARRRPDIWTLW